MRTANPALSDRYFAAEAAAAPRSTVMTVNGAAVKTGILAAVLLAAGGLSWSLVFPGGVGPDATVNRDYALLFVLGGAFGGKWPLNAPPMIRRPLMAGRWTALIND